mgnify:CR=1 FL=1
MPGSCLTFAALVALFSVASAVELTPANFEAEVKGDKNAFVKFQAPWCVHNARSRAHEQAAPLRPAPEAEGVWAVQVRPLQAHETCLGK